ncbi:hypothetical protein SAMN05428949_1994 [Chitinophaga sp. YR627]|uniref:hypothetical protein n=1 Tax=Chitinophaga sp. YR627 TaxID=1881041 RepID=UPI0008E29B05|nr:hypothetical protein [Chitinophaga sp. YR627]SFN22093.1 hypothetical protein SAMN05428949_1994 [Chitinophaga sp. YR627]
MNIRLFACLLACMAIFSCSKDDTTTNPPAEEVTHLFTRIDAGSEAGTDAIYLFSYDSLGRIKSMVDSIPQVVMKAAYGSNSKLSTLTYDYPSGASITVTFKYNADSLLTEIDAKQWIGNQYTFEYQNGVLVRCNWYTAGNDYSLWRYYTYEMENGNIVKMVTHYANGDLDGTTTYTYTDAPNRFNPLGIIVMFKGPSLYFLHSFETLFNKNMIATFQSGTHISTCEYVYNTQNQLT